MKKNNVIFVFLLLFSGMILAHGANPFVPKNSSVLSKKHKPLEITAVLYPGSLKANVERIADENGWSKVVWNAHSDYNWVVYTKIKEKNLVAIMESIFKSYPLRATFYQGNRVLVIDVRTMR